MHPNKWSVTGRRDRRCRSLLGAKPAKMVTSPHFTFSHFIQIFVRRNSINWNWTVTYIWVINWVNDSLRESLASSNFLCCNKGLFTYYVSRWRGGRGYGKCWPFFHHYQGSIDFNIVNIHSTVEMYFFVSTGNWDDIAWNDQQRS